MSPVHPPRRERASVALHGPASRRSPSAAMTTLRPGILKLSLLNVAAVALFAASDFRDAIFMLDPLGSAALCPIAAFLLVSATALTFGILCARIGPEGICPVFTGLYRRTFRWDELTHVSSLDGFPLFLILRGMDWTDYLFCPCLLPRPRLLKDHATLGNLVARYARPITPSAPPSPSPSASPPPLWPGFSTRAPPSPPAPRACPFGPAPGPGRTHRALRH